MFAFVRRIRLFVTTQKTTPVVILPGVTIPTMLKMIPVIFGLESIKHPFYYIGLKKLIRFQKYILIPYRVILVKIIAELIV